EKACEFVGKFGYRVSERDARAGAQAGLPNRGLGYARPCDCGQRRRVRHRLGFSVEASAVSEYTSTFGRGRALAQTGFPGSDDVRPDVFVNQKKCGRCCERGTRQWCDLQARPGQWIDAFVEL